MGHYISPKEGCSILLEIPLKKKNLYDNKTIHLSWRMWSKCHLSHRCQKWCLLFSDITTIWGISFCHVMQQRDTKNKVNFKDEWSHSPGRGSCYQKDNLLKKDEVNISTDRNIEMNQNKK